VFVWFHTPRLGDLSPESQVLLLQLGIYKKSNSGRCEVAVYRLRFVAGLIVLELLDAFSCTVNISWHLETPETLR
jgi:hypothetical protein